MGAQSAWNRVKVRKYRFYSEDKLPYSPYPHPLPLCLGNGPGSSFIQLQPSPLTLNFRSNKHLLPLVHPTSRSQVESGKGGAVDKAPLPPPGPLCQTPSSRPPTTKHKPKQKQRNQVIAMSSGVEESGAREDSVSVSMSMSMIDGEAHPDWVKDKMRKNCTGCG